MNSHAQKSESDRLREIAREYQEKGYRVILEPDGAQLPGALAKFRPDLLATSPQENVVVEVRASTRLPVETEMPALAGAVASLPGWRFELAVVGEGEITPMPPAAKELDAAEINRRAEAVRQLLRGAQTEAAVLMAWSVAEAAMRTAARAHGISLEKSPPLLLIKELYSAGMLDRMEYEQLQDIMRGRNLLAHGYSWPEVDEQRVNKLLDLADRLTASSVAPA